MGKKPQRLDHGFSESGHFDITERQKAGNDFSEAESCLKMLCAVTGLRAASLYFVMNGSRRVLAAHNSPRAFCTYPDNVANNPFNHGRRVLAPDIDKKPALRKALQRAVSGLDSSYWKALIRLTFTTETGERFSAIAHGLESREAFSQAEIRQLDEIENALRAICFKLLPKLRRFGNKPGFPISLSELKAIVATASRPMSIRDETFRLLAASPALEELLGQPIQAILGEGLTVATGKYSYSVETLMRHAVETGFTTPAIEIGLPIPADKRVAAFEFHASPVYLVGRKQPVFVIHYSEPGRFRGSKVPVPRKGDGNGATADFLFETLIRHRCIRSRNDISYITVRSWNSAIRTHQIKALTAIKSHEFSGFAERIGKELQEEINRIAGFGGFAAIIPVPGGHSHPNSNLSNSIARCVSRLANIPLLEAFEHQRLSGASHPKTNVSRPALVLNSRIAQPVILIDDVATSGRHIEECVKLLKKSCGSVLAVAWIGGNITPEK